MRSKSSLGPALVELGVGAGRPTTFSQFFPESGHPRLHFGGRRRGSRGQLVYEWRGIGNGPLSLRDDDTVIE
jgi:hypothetical protein